MTSQFFTRQALTDEQIRAQAPSVFATEHHPSITGHYAFISTARMLDALRAEGFMPVRVQQAGSARALALRYTNRPAPSPRSK
jgi:hypothetical protein